MLKAIIDKIGLQNRRYLSRATEEERPIPKEKIKNNNKVNCICFLWAKFIKKRNINPGIVIKVPHNILIYAYM